MSRSSQTVLLFSALVVYADASLPKGSMLVVDSGVSMPMNLTRSVRPAMSISAVSPSITRWTLASSTSGPGSGVGVGCGVGRLSSGGGGVTSLAAVLVGGCGVVTTLATTG